MLSPDPRSPTSRPASLLPVGGTGCNKLTLAWEMARHAGHFLSGQGPESWFTSLQPPEHTLSPKAGRTPTASHSLGLMNMLLLLLLLDWTTVAVQTGQCL